VIRCELPNEEEVVDPNLLVKIHATTNPRLVQFNSSGCGALPKFLHAHSRDVVTGASRSFRSSRIANRLYFTKDHYLCLSQRGLQRNRDAFERGNLRRENGYNNESHSSSQALHSLIIDRGSACRQCFNATVALATNGQSTAKRKSL